MNEFTLISETDISRPAIRVVYETDDNIIYCVDFRPLTEVAAYVARVSKPLPKEGDTPLEWEKGRHIVSTAHYARKGMHAIAAHLLQDTDTKATWEDVDFWEGT